MKILIKQEIERIMEEIAIGWGRDIAHIENIRFNDDCELTLEEEKYSFSSERGRYQDGIREITLKPAKWLIRVTSKLGPLPPDHIVSQFGDMVLCYMRHSQVSFTHEEGSYNINLAYRKDGYLLRNECRCGQCTCEDDDCFGECNDDECECTPFYSCMEGQNVGPFYELFGVKVIVAHYKGKKVGRALLWEAEDSCGKAVILMDRVYVCDHLQWVKESFFSYAKENGYYRKENQSASQGEQLLSPSGKKVIMKLWVRTTSPMPSYSPYTIGYIPYMDSFYYLSENGVLANTAHGLYDFKTLTSTNGTFSD